MKTPVKDSLVVFKTGAEVNFRLYGNVAPVFGLNINGEPKIIPIIFSKPEDKDSFRKYILKMIANGSISEFVFVAECWAAKTPNMEFVMQHLQEHGSLESYPGREEIIQVLYCSATEEVCYTTTIDRGTMTLGKWEETTRSGYSIPEFSARFQGLFAQGNSGNN